MFTCEFHIVSGSVLGVYAPRRVVCAREATAPRVVTDGEGGGLLWMR